MTLPEIQDAVEKFVNSRDGNIPGKSIEPIKKEIEEYVLTRETTRKYVRRKPKQKYYVTNDGFKRRRVYQDE